MTPEKLSKMYTDVSNVFWKCEAHVGSYYHMWWSCRAVVFNLCYSDAFELQLPETLVRTAGGEGFWELQSKTPE